MAQQNNWPKLHNAMWPGVVGKGAGFRTAHQPRRDARHDRRGRGRRRQIRRRRSLPRRSAHQHRFQRRRHQAARRQGRRQKSRHRLDGGAGMAAGRRRLGDGQRGRAQALRRRMVEKACRIGKKLRELGVRPYGVVRIDSATGVHDWAADPAGNTKLIAQTFSEACDVAEELWRAPRRRGRDLLGRHAWLEEHGRSARDGRTAQDARLPGRHGAHAALYARLQRARGAHPARRISTGTNTEVFHAALKQLTDALRPWTIDFHVAQNDATVKGSGLARQDRPPLHCQRSQRQARYRPRRRLLAARRRRAS